MQKSFDWAQYWDWTTGNAALMGGVTSGIASGVAAYLIFSLWLKAERKRLREHESGRRAELAFNALSKLHNWLDCGSSIAGLISRQLSEQKAAFESGNPKSMIVLPLIDSLPEPEKLAVSEVAFLAFRDKAELINRIFEIQSWGHHLLVLSRQYTKHCLEWDEWALMHTFEPSLSENERSVTTNFDNNYLIPGKMRISKMDNILESILTDHEKIGKLHKETVSDYIADCKK